MHALSRRGYGSFRSADDCEIRSIDMEVDSGRVARDGNVSIPRKQVLNASVTACSSSIGCAAANGDRDGTRRGWGRENEREGEFCARRSATPDTVDVDAGPLDGRVVGG